MAQADGVVSNASGAAVRADLNNQLAAVFTNHSGATEPTTTYAYQWWADSTTGLLKIRNAANSAWVTVGTLADVNLGLLAASGGTLTGALLAAAGSASTPSIAFSGDTNTGIYSPGSDQIAISTGGTQRLAVDSSGNITIDTNTLYVDAANNRVGVGTTTPGNKLSVRDGDIALTAGLNVADAGQSIRFFANGVDDTSNNYAEIKGGLFSASTPQQGYLRFSTSGSERARIDTSGRLLVGTSSAPTILASQSKFNIAVGDEGAAVIGRWSSNQFGPSFVLAKSRSTSVGTSTVVQSGDSLGVIYFAGADGVDLDSTAASIEAFVDSTPGSNDMPGRLVFATTADGASSPTERVRITNGGYFKASNSGSYSNSTSGNHEFNQSANDYTLFQRATFATYTGAGNIVAVDRAANSAYYFYIGSSNYAVSADTEFGLRGDGNGYCDGTWSGGGADYAEFFEWSDSNPNAEDRRGISVVLDGDKIREAQPGEDPIGVISGNPSVVGDAAWNKWSGKYLRDEFGTYIQEDYEVTDEDGNTVIQQRRKLNPAYDPDVEYVSRENRPEWDCVGLMGKLRIRKGQATGSRWIKMRDISDSVEEWLVR